jgi:hypothetical protein
MSAADTVWSNTVDNHRYYCRVTRKSEYVGTLQVADADGALIHEEDVGLAYGAPFGPDVDDVAAWQDRCVEVIDDPNKRMINV